MGKLVHYKACSTCAYRQCVDQQKYTNMLEKTVLRLRKRDDAYDSSDSDADDDSRNNNGEARSDTDNIQEFILAATNAAR